MSASGDPGGRLAAAGGKLATGGGSLAARWAVLAASVALGFHETFLTTARQAFDGDPLAYLFLLPLCAGAVVRGTCLRRQSHLAIHDRQVDWIAAAGLVLGIALLDLLLLPRLGVTEQLTRIDVLALLLFVMAGCTLLFGSRSTGRFWAIWALLLASWPLPYRLAGAALGGTAQAYALLDVVLVTVAAALAAGEGIASRARAAALAGAVGTAGVLLLRPLPAVALELGPAALGLTISVLVSWRGHRAPGSGRSARQPAAVPDQSKPAPAAVPRPAAAMGVLLLLSGWLGFLVHLAPPSIAESTLVAAGRGWVGAPLQPPDWELTARQGYPWAAAYFGSGARWRRFLFRQQGAAAGTGAVALDALTSLGTGPLAVYPAISCYRLAAPYIESPDPVPLGGGVEATLFYPNSADALSPLDAEWVMLTWTWRVPDEGAGSVQRLTVVTVEGNASSAGLPSPAPPGTGADLRSTFADILRGVPSAASPAPAPAALRRLEGFAREVVSLQEREGADRPPAARGATS